MNSNPPLPRLHFRTGVAVEHVEGDTYKWVDPVTGLFRGYVVATHVIYEPTIERQMVRQRK